MKYLQIILISLSFISSVSYGFGKARNSSIEINYEANNNDAKITFKAVPNKGLIANFSNAPWSFKVKKSENISFVNNKISAEKLDQKLPGFHTSATVSTNKKISFDFDMVAFVCTKDKTKCYRDAHKQTCSINKNKVTCKTRSQK